MTKQISLPESIVIEIDKRKKKSLKPGVIIKRRDVVMAALHMFFNQSELVTKCHLERIELLKQRHKDTRQKLCEAKTDSDNFNSILEQIVSICKEVKINEYEIENHKEQK